MLNRLFVVSIGMCCDHHLIRDNYCSSPARICDINRRGKGSRVPVASEATDELGRRSSYRSFQLREGSTALHLSRLLCNLTINFFYIQSHHAFHEFRRA